MKNGMSEMANLAARSTALSRWSQGKILALLATGLLAVPTTSSAIVLDFEGVGDLNPVADFYDGNLGADYDIVFSGDNLALEDASSSGDFLGEPSPTTAMFLVDTGSEPYDPNRPVGATLDCSVGFASVSFYYAALVDGFANVYDGVGGTGNLSRHRHAFRKSDINLFSSYLRLDSHIDVIQRHRDVDRLRWRQWPDWLRRHHS